MLKFCLSTLSILCAVSLLSLFSGCYKESHKEDPRVFYYSTDEQEKADLYFASHTRKVNFEGHRFLFFRDSWKEEGERTAAIVHDPNCPTCVQEIEVSKCVTHIEK